MRLALPNYRVDTDPSATDEGLFLQRDAHRMFCASRTQNVSRYASVNFAFGPDCAGIGLQKGRLQAPVVGKSGAHSDNLIAMPGNAGYFVQCDSVTWFYSGSLGTRSQLQDSKRCAQLPFSVFRRQSVSQSRSA